MHSKPAEKSSSKSFLEKRGQAPFLREAGVSCLYLGLSPVAPGTAGTLGGVAIAMLLPGGPSFPIWAAVAAAAVFVLGYSLAPWAERHYGRKDPPRFVLDEVLGYLVTVMPMQPRWTAAATNPVSTIDVALACDQDSVIIKSA